MAESAFKLRYRPSGPLLRLLRLERWLCPACKRDNLLRRGYSVLSHPCHWCGAPLLQRRELSPAEKIALVMYEFQRACARSMAAWAREMEKTTRVIRLWAERMTAGE